MLETALDGTVRSWNEGAESLYGYRADEIVGKAVDVLAAPGSAGEIEEIGSRVRRGGAIRHLETVRRRKDGTLVHVSLTVTPVRGANGEIVGASSVAHDIGERKRREEIQSFLAEASRLLAVDLDYRETLSRVAHLALSRIADWCMVETADADGSFTQVAVAHRDPDKAELARELRRLYPPRADRPDISLRVLRTGRGELIPDVSDALLENVAQDAVHLGMLRRLGPTSLIVVPLRVRERTLGTILLANTESERPLGPEDLDLAEDLARRAALAIDNATLHRSEHEARREAEQSAERIRRLYEAERRARAAAELAIGRTRRLQSLAAELAEALTTAQVAEVVVRQGIASVGADAGALQLPSDDGTMLEVAHGQGSDRALIDEEWQRFPVDANVPSTDALRTLAPVFVESEQDIEERYPHVESYPPLLAARSSLHARAGAHIPLVISGRALGVLFLGFARPRRFSASQRSFVLALGRQCAQALKRAQLYEAELEARSRLTRLVERLHEGVVSVDRSGRVQFASSTARQLLATVALEEGSLLPEAWLGFPLRSFAAGLFESDERVAEARLVSGDVEQVFELTGIPAARSEAALLVVTDVSARERRLRVEREFVDNAAHELRTPLAAITSAIERLQAGAREVPERRDRFLGHIQHESARLNRLAASLLVLARAQTRGEEPRREEIPLRALLEELSGGLALARGVELVLDCASDLVARSNHDLLEHAVLNLLTNAARYTEHGRVRVGASAATDGSVTIEVVDTGCGMSPDELDRLFDRFYRGPGEDGRAGFGLGLPIVKEAVEAIGGRVEIDSVPGAGTAARIVLPDALVAVLS